jgi:hypothetical protein
VVRDTTGFPLASAARVELRFQLANLIGKRVVFSSITLTRPRIYLEKHRSGRLNFEEVMRIGERPPGSSGPPGPGTLIDFQDVTIRDGILTVLTPWSMPGHLARRALGRLRALPRSGWFRRAGSRTAERRGAAAAADRSRA